MATKAPGNFVRVNQDIWSDEIFRSLSKGARSAYLLLLCWSKQLRRDGVVSTLGLQHCDVTDGEREELISCGYLSVTDTGWLLTDYAEWQITAAETSARREEFAAHGRRGAAKRWRNPRDKRQDNGGETAAELALFAGLPLRAKGVA